MNELKAAAGCTEQNVVLGQSMGGVLAKLALREMEEAGEDHQCCKLFTHDSPLRGANIPLGYQYMLDQVANIKIAHLYPLKNFIGILADAETTLNAPGPRQMLIYHKDHFPSSVRPFSQFYQKLRNLGALEQYEHIAISNGSQISSGQGYGANDLMLKIKADGGDLLEDCADFSGFWAEFVQILANLLSNVAVKVDFEVRALPAPAQGEKTIYKGLASAKLLFTIPIVLDSRHVKVSGTQPLDNTSGGYIEVTIDDLDPCLNQIVQLEQPLFCFIPTVSAIELGPFVGAGVPLSNVNADISNNAAILASGLTTVDRFVAFDDAIPPGAPSSAFNQYHIAYSRDNTGVLLYELLSAASPANPLNNRTFNFGTSNITAYDYSNPPSPFPVKQTTNVIQENLTIEGSGKIWVNRNDRIAFTDDPGNPEVANPSIFRVSISGAACNDDATTVTVKNGGEISVGEWNATANNIGMLHVSKDATLNIDRNGTVEVADHARLFSEEEGVTNVLNGGLLHVNWWDGKIIVRKGGVLRVHSGGTLRVSNGAAVEVEDGGTLIIEPQAKIQLWGGVVQNDGESRIHIKQGGALVINGEFDFSHDGYFRFDNGYSLTLGSGTFKMKGVGKNNRFLQLNHTDLVITGNQMLDFRDGRIQYTSATVTAQEGGKIVFNNVKCTGSGRALYLNDPNQVSVNQVDIIEGFNPAIEAWNVRNNIPFNVSNCNIEVGTTNGVEAYYCQMLRFSNTNFIEPTPADQSTGIWLKSVQMLSLTNCNLSNMWKGIDAIDSRVVRMSGGEIADCDIGINDDYSIVYGGTPVHVMMFDGATIRNSLDKAIYILGGKSAGSVLMDCAKLIDNANGIVGEDITLMVDAEENRQCITDPVSPNTFKRLANQGPFFSICYDQKDIGQVDAKANHWFPHNPGDWKPIPGSWMLHKVVQGGNGQCTDFVGFNSNLAVQNEPPGCTYPTFPCQHGEPPAPLAECEILLENEPFIVQEEFHSGINAIKGENLELGETLLTPVSELKGELGNALNGVCKNLVDMAYAIIETEVESRPSVRWRAGRNDRGLDDAVSIAPNPAADFVQLGCSGQFLINVVDGLGRVIWDESAEDFVVLNTRSWPTGVYNIRVQTAGKQVQKTLVIQR